MSHFLIGKYVKICIFYKKTLKFIYENSFEIFSCSKITEIIFPSGV